jgi:hypothetical protein
MEIDITCPVCNNVSHGRFCEHCGFELHILPSEVSPEVSSYEQERVDRYKALLKSQEDLEMTKIEKLSIIENRDAEIENLKEQNYRLTEDLRHQQEMLEQTENAKPLAYLVMMQGESVSSIFGIYEGNNSFGYTKSNDRHQQIICNGNVDVADNHFIVRAVSSVDSKGRTRTKFYVAPQDGKIYHSAKHANIIGSEIEFEKKDSVFIDDVRFTLVANK